MHSLRRVKATFEMLAKNHPDAIVNTLHSCAEISQCMHYFAKQFDRNHSHTVLTQCS